MNWTEAEYAAYRARRQGVAPADNEAERDFQAWVLTQARRCGWLAYHTHDARKSQPGFPDLVLARHGECLMAELKTRTGKLTPEQQTWLSVLASAGVEVHCWRPGDKEAISARLARRQSG